MLPYRDSRITRVILATFFVLIIAYAYFEAQGILYGPHIEVSSEIQEVADPFIAIKGGTKRIAKLSMNGRSISVTEDGAFEEAYLLAPGLNRIILDAEDHYGRTTQHVMQIVYTPPDDSQKSTNQVSTTSVPSSEPESATFELESALSASSSTSSPELAP